MDPISEGTQYILDNYSDDETLENYIKDIEESECDSDLNYAIRNIVLELEERNDENLDIIKDYFEGFI